MRLHAILTRMENRSAHLIGVGIAGRIGAKKLGIQPSLKRATSLQAAGWRGTQRQLDWASMVRILQAIAGVLMILLPGGCATTGSGVGEKSIVTHDGTQFQFPKRVGNFERVDVKKYDAAGTDMGVGYNDVQNGVAVTVYVYPVRANAGNSVVEHFKVCKNDVMMAHGGTKPVAENSIQVAPGGKPQEGRWASFAYKQEFAHRDQLVASELYLFQKGPWFIKYRATYPMTAKATGEQAVEGFIGELRWPE